MRRRAVSWAALTAALGMVGTQAAAAPVWLEAPTYADAAAAYPARARAARVAGSAELTCTVNPSGRLRDCGVLAESPGGYGFGNAARKLAERLQVQRGPDLAAGAEMRVAIAFPAAMADGSTYVATTPTWAALPAAEDFRRTFPKNESGANSVRVSLVCQVAQAGGLTGCQVESEDPPGHGYGDAVLALAPLIKVGLLTSDGVPLVGAKVRVPLRYELTPVSPPAKP